MGQSTNAILFYGFPIDEDGDNAQRIEEITDQARAQARADDTEEIAGKFLDGWNSNAPAIIGDHCSGLCTTCMRELRERGRGAAILVPSRLRACHALGVDGLGISASSARSPASRCNLADGGLSSPKDTRHYPTLCGDCQTLQSSRNEVTHRSLIRCPGCGTTRAVEELFQEGEHSVCCWNCELDFTVVCEVSYSFRSPKRILEDYSGSEGR
jgi:hypothetical protein